LDRRGVETANIGTGVKKVWGEVYGAWGEFTVGGSRGMTGKVGARGSKNAGGKRVGKRSAEEPEARNGTVVKKVMMPKMPVRKTKLAA
jgi:A/G-specific adenine glycosylase